MTSDATDPGSTLPPDDAFSVLGNETRLTILHALAGADGPLSFSALYDRVGVRDSGQFNYHLGKVEGHFVRKTDEGYELRQAGRRIVEAVLAGAVAEAPDRGLTEVDAPCPLCGAATLIAYNRGRVEHYCTECAGHYTASTPSGESEADEYGFLGGFELPPAGFTGRAPEDVFDAAAFWGFQEIYSMARQVCPRCSAFLDATVSVCSDHDTADGRCGECGMRYAAKVRFSCTNCHFQEGGPAVLALVDAFEVQEFLVDHEINPVAPSDQAAFTAALTDYAEDVVSESPFEARFTLGVDDDSLTLAVDENLTVVDVD